MHVIKRNGDIVDVDFAKIHWRIKSVCARDDILNFQKKERPEAYNVFYKLPPILHADVDTITVSKMTSTKLGGENTISYGLEVEYEDETYYQLYFSYFKDGYFVTFSAVSNENSEEVFNQILESVNINK